LKLKLNAEEHREGNLNTNENREINVVQTNTSKPNEIQAIIWKQITCHVAIANELLRLSPTA
jgi:hypothetical protein